MAYINVLPIEDRKRLFNLRHSLFVVGIIFYLVLLSWLYFINYYQLHQKNIEYRTLKNQIAIMEPAVERLNGLEKDQQNLQSKLEYGRNLIQKKYFSQVMLVISELIPEDVVLSRLNYEDYRFSFEGEAPDYENVALLITNLKSSGYFTEVDLKSSFINQEHENIGFKITAKLTLQGE